MLRLYPVELAAVNCRVESVAVGGVYSGGARP